MTCPYNHSDPIYKEANVFASINRLFNQTGLPSTKLDIKILMEEDDEDTIKTFYESIPTSIRWNIVPAANRKQNRRL